MSRDGRRSRRAYLLRLVVSAAILAVLVAWLPWADLIGAIRRVSPALWALVLLGFLAGHAASALKWSWLLQACGARTRFAGVLRAHGAGLAGNLVLPSLVGGDVVRAGLAARGDEIERVAVGTVADRVLDTAALLALIAAGVPFLPALSGAGGRLLPGLAAVLGLGAAFATGLWLLTRARLPRRLRRPAARLREATAALLRHPGRAIAAGLAAVAVQAAFVLLAVALGRAMELTLPLAAWFVLWPLAKLAALVPVSLGGIGVREVAWSALAAPFGVAPVLAVGLALVWDTVLVAGGLAAGAAALWTPDAKGRP